jgi:hypothetical protein
MDKLREYLDKQIGRDIIVGFTQVSPT